MFTKNLGDFVDLTIEAVVYKNSVNILFRWLESLYTQDIDSLIYFSFTIFFR